MTTEARNKFKSGFITIIGRPNVGKSTLLNRIVGQKIAIMSNKPQTTRNKIFGVYTTEQEQIVFIDTPGIHKPKHKLGQFMVDVAQKSLKQVDAILYLVDVSEKIGPGEQYIIENLKGVTTPVYLALNKIDLIDQQELLPQIEKLKSMYSFKEIVPISAKENDNVELLLKLLAKELPVGPQYYPQDMITDQPERLVVAELIREKVLHLTKEEVPHSIAVIVEMMEPRPNGKIFISSNIYVERDSQKGILIGKGGKMMKDIGARARRDIENLLGNKVYLDLWIKVKKDWRNQEAAIRNMGFRDD
ncbi:GTP-binding protein Era [Desulfitispora alkaliphila]|uniref:GTPase Era n=1 Tax=Desulfitispora alkaliphila TaxID=622674 RepID=UPI003D1AF78A